ncbi:MAG: LamG-like jellyroll fold domain-containing protein [Flavobacteriales bacterium]
MKKTLAILFLISSIGIAQNIDEPIDFSGLYKIEASPDIKDPEWVHLLYESNPNYFKISDAYSKYHSNHAFKKSIHTQNYKYFMQKVSDEMEILENGYLQPIPSHYSVASSSMSSSNGWTNIGPMRTYSNNKLNSSQVNVYCIDHSKSDPNKMLVGITAGLIYISHDKGQTWTSLGTDYLYTGSITTVRFDPINDNIMYAGGGNRLYKSTDAGVTWSEIMNISSLKIRHLAIDPTNSDIMYVAANKGLYKSTNGGTSWTQLNSNRHWDVKLNPQNHNVVYTLRSDPTKKFTEFWKSTNSGASFTLQSTGWYNPSFPAVTDYGARMGLSQSDTNRIYVALLASDSDPYPDAGFAGIYRSDDAGESWSLPYDGDADGVPDNYSGGPYSADHWCFSGFSPMNSDGSGYHQGYYNLGIEVSATNPDHFMVGFLNLYASEDGGTSYESYGGYSYTAGGGYYQHPDIQDIHFHDGKFYVSSDGGLDSYDSTFNYIESNIDGIIGSNYWGFDNGWNKDITVGGRYHNGNAVHIDTYGEGNHISIGGGERATGYVNVGNENIVHHSDISSWLMTDSLNGGKTRLPKYVMYPNESYSRHGSSEIIIDPRYYDHFYLGKQNKIWKTTNGGQLFTLVHEFDTVETNLITQLEISRNNPNIIFAVQKNILWKSTNQGATWTQLTLPSSSSYVSISLNADDVLFVGFNTSSSSAGKIYKSTNLGSSWTNLTTSVLTNAQVDYISIQEGTNNGVYIGTSRNIWYKDDTMADWTSLKNGLPLSVYIRKTKPFYKKGVLRMSSNMGIWERNLENKSLPLAQPITKTDKIYCHRDTVYFDSYSVLEDSNSTFSWEFPGASYVSGTNTRTPKVVYDQLGNYNVKLTVSNYLGSDSKTIPNMIRFEENYCKPDSNANQSVYLNDDYLQSEEYEDNPIYDEMSFSMWVKPDSTQTGSTGLMTFFSHDPSNTINVVHYGHDNEIVYRWNGQNSHLLSGLFIKPDEWNYLAMTLKEDTIVMYLNNEKNTTILPNVYPLYLKSINIGSYRTWKDRKFTGEIDEVKVWTRALSEEEIQLKRHLTIPDPSQETDLLCYYQFNNSSNYIYDKIGDKHLTKRSNQTLVPSSLPVGAGVSEMKTVTSPSVQNFLDAECDITFGPNGLTPNSQFVVSKLNAQPFHKPSTYDLHDAYWIVNSYKTTTNPKINAMNFKSFPVLTDVDSSNLFLWNRNENEGDLNNWNDISSGFTVTPPMIQTTQLNLNNSGQFFIGTSLPNLSTEEISEELETKKSIQIYPNPVQSEHVLNVLNEKGLVKIRIYDVSGKIIDILSSDNEMIQIPITKNYKSGLYYISIESKTEIENSSFTVY